MRRFLGMIQTFSRRYWSLCMFLLIAFLTAGFGNDCNTPTHNFPVIHEKVDRRFYQGGLGANGTSRALAFHPPTGLVFVGGEFSSAGNEEAHNIAVYDPVTNELHPLKNLGVNGIVYALAISGNDLYVGGDFTETADGETGLIHIARYKIFPDTTDEDEQRWFPLTGGGVDQIVSALAADGNKLFVGGTDSAGFSGSGAVSINGFAIYELNGGGVWHPIANNGLNGNVHALALAGDDVYVGGNFTAPFTGPTPVIKRIARYHLNADNSGEWFSLQHLSNSTGLNNTVRALAMQQNFLYVGGDFTNNDGGPIVSLRRIARYKTNASVFEPAWSALANDGLDYPVFAIASGRFRMTVGGAFTSTGDNMQQLSHVAEYSESGGSHWFSLPDDGLTGGNVYALTPYFNDFIYVGGSFYSIVDAPVFELNGFMGYDFAPVIPRNQSERNTSKKLGTPSDSWAQLGFHNGKALDNTINALATDANGYIYAGGNFIGTADGSMTNLNRIARYDPVTATWSPLANDGLNGIVNALAIDGDNLYVGGIFTRTGDLTLPMNRIARYNLTTNTWSTLTGNGLNDAVYALVISGSNLFAGGDFSRTANNAILNLNKIARFNTSTNTWSPLTDNGLNFSVNSLAVSGSDLYAGGFFRQTFGGATTNLNFIARYNTGTNTWSALAENGLDSSVSRLIISGNYLYVRGNFSQTYNATIGLDRLADYDTSTNTWSPMTGAQDDYERAILGNAMVRSGNEIYIAGSFIEIDGEPARYFTRFYLQQWAVPAISSDWFDDANWTTGFVPTANSNAVISAGAGQINITSSDVTMNDLMFNGGTLTIGAGRTLTINGVLGLNGGTINGAGTLVIANCQPDGIMGGDSSVYIQTALVRCVNDADTFNFPVGTANGYSPVTVKGISGTGNISVKANQGAYSNPASGLPANRLARWWHVENPGGGVTDAEVFFGYRQSDIAGNENNYHAYRVASEMAQMIDSTVNIYSNRVSAQNVTSFSDWTLAEAVPTAATVSLGGRVTAGKGTGVFKAVVTLTGADGTIRTALTNSFGFYRFDDVPAGETYILSVRHKRYQFEMPTQIVFAEEDLNGVNFTAMP